MRSRQYLPHSRRCARWPCASVAFCGAATSKSSLPGCMTPIIRHFNGIRRFVHTLRQDLAAVRNAITETWSNGQTEGQINRLKTLKRAMYGSAGIELLRARVLPIRPTEQHAD